MDNQLPYKHTYDAHNEELSLMTMLVTDIDKYNHMAVCNAIRNLQQIILLMS